ncbi:MAG TPA: antitoxin Xre/MbcA/ParS toxin-binding domain-containing protein [Chitinophagaceae bacterium]|nr:antitoxin Xre/MbcA/ParS toxin-binding domain-containing protein [Chitinophagaceae bacterium]
MPAVKKPAKKSTRRVQVAVEEASVSYHSRPLKGESVLKVVKGPENKLTGMEKMELVEGGIPKQSLESLKQQIGFDYDQLAQVLNVARATLINKKSSEKFNTDLSDKIMNLADIISYGFEVFEDRSRFKAWLQLPNRALAGKRPFDLLHTSFGRDEVRDLLGRIDHGIYS